MENGIHNLFILAEDIFVSWAADNLKSPAFMQMGMIPAEQRDPKCPIKWTVMASAHPQELIKAQESNGERGG
jgi:hypothetical protein